MNDKVTNQVFTTTNYGLFKTIDGNRTKNISHINRLKKSMSENYLFTIIIVNEKRQIIDGQHRFEVIKELGLPLNYIICKGYGLNEVHILNQNSTTWGSDDYMNGYCDLGYVEYIKYRDFKNKYKIGHFECMALLCSPGNSRNNHLFYSGNMKCTSISSASAFMDKIFQIAPYYKGYKRRSFIMCMKALMTKKHFKFDELLHKLKLQPTTLQDCGTIEQYTEMIESIYNYRRSDKVNLRF